VEVLGKQPALVEQFVALLEDVCVFVEAVVQAVLPVLELVDLQRLSPDEPCLVLQELQVVVRAVSVDQLRLRRQR
jgi:hypothetical protein